MRVENLLKDMLKDLGTIYAREYPGWTLPMYYLLTVRIGDKVLKSKKELEEFVKTVSDDEVLELEFVGEVYHNGWGDDEDPVATINVKASELKKVLHTLTRKSA